MSETETAAASSPGSAAAPGSAVLAKPIRARQQSRGWLALIFQVLSLAGAAAAGFAASHYFTTQQQQAAERQRGEAQANATAAASALPLVTVPPAAESSDADTAAEPPAEVEDPQRPFSEEVERAEMINTQDVDPVTPTSLEPAVESTDEVPVEEGTPKE